MRPPARITSVRWAAPGLAAALLIGCMDQAPRPESPEDGGVTLRVGDRAALEEILAAHRGKVVLVDYWATWCGPCVELFPHNVRLARELGGQGLVVVTVSLDRPADRHNVLAFLRQQGATFENLISPYGISPASAEEFAFDGTLPTVRIYDRSGKAGEPLVGPTPEEVEDAVRRVL